MQRMGEEMKPQEIEDKSFEIIETEAGEHSFSNEEWNIVRRMIHTSADFEYMKSVRIHKDAIKNGITAIRSGCNIITDTNMAKAGIRKNNIINNGGDVICMIADDEVKEESKKTGQTRALIAVEKAAELMKGGIYVVGNAPTALIRLTELIETGQIAPVLVIGLPVGFVNTSESKEMLLNSDFPYITNVGRKGGSNIAASVVNALIIMSETNK